MKKREIISKEKLQKKILDILNFRLIGILVSIPQNDSITPSELGGNLYLYDIKIIGEPCISKKFEVHMNKYGKLLLQLLNDDAVESYIFFENIKDLEKKIKKIKDLLKAEAA